MAVEKIDTSRTVREIEAAEMAEVQYDSSDPAQVNKAKSHAGRRKTKRLSFIQKMMEDPEGRRWIWEFMESCRVFSNPVVTGDTHLTYFQLGEQNVGKHLLFDTQAFPALYLQMTQEAKNEFN